MTSPTLTSQPAARASLTPRKKLERLGIPLGLFLLTLASTTAVGMRYMHNFTLGRAPISDDADILPYVWVFHNLAHWALGLPFSLTLIAILLAHEFGHYFACRAFQVRSTLPYMLPAPSLSGTFGAVIRLRSRIPSRSALIVIAAMGPICGFVVAIAAVIVGLRYSIYLPTPVLHRVQAPLLLLLVDALQHATAFHLTIPPLQLLLPHPILSAAWLGILITSLNLIPAGQLDGGHIAYALSPTVHKITSRVATVLLLVLGVISWVGWLLWGLILLSPGMRHPRVPSDVPVKRWHFALVPICIVILLLAFTYQPFQGYSLLDVFHKLPNRYHAHH